MDESYIHDQSRDHAAALEAAVLEVVEQFPMPVQVWRRDGTVIVENAAFRARPKLRHLAEEVEAGRPSAFHAALTGHVRVFPLGVTDGTRVVAIYAPLRSEGEEEISHVSVTYVTSKETVERAEHRAPTLYATAQSTLIETQLRFIVDNVPQLIWCSQPDGSADFYNRRWSEYVGASVEAQGAGWNDCMHPDDQQLAWEIWQESLRTGTTYETVSRIRRHDGTYRWFLGRAVPMHDADGRIVRWFGSATDIDDKKRSEQQRDDALAALQKATQLKDEFLATASHELRTPLTAILGWSAMQRLDPSLAGRAMEAIERNAKTLADLINDLLDSSRIVANKITIDRTVLDLRGLIHSVIESARPAALSKALTLDVYIDEHVACISADANRLRQVVSNLLSNAIKFTPPYGKVRVEAHASATEVLVRITDNGKGITPEFLPHVFERFRQADGTHTRREGGLGLGLSIARHLVELHGGSLRAESEGTGRGSTFTVTMPAASTPVPCGERTSEAQGSEVRLDGIRVLVVDDERDTRELLRALLTRAGATVDQAASVDAALERIAAIEPDIVLSDVNMPEQSGFDLATELGARRFGRPVVALTAFARPEDRDEALRTGFDDHIAKPVEPTTLVKAIARLVERSAAKRTKWTASRAVTQRPASRTQRPTRTQRPARTQRRPSR